MSLAEPESRSQKLRKLLGNPPLSAPEREKSLPGPLLAPPDSVISSREGPDLSPWFILFAAGHR